MKSISPRGKAPALNFEEVMLTGLASDGGLYVPETLPTYTQDEIASWVGLPYADLALKIVTPFVDGCIPDNELKKIVDESYSNFRHSAIAPLKQLGHNEWILELFHGPTLAFKDFALQMLGGLLDYVLTKRNQKVIVLGATSGDTGSAAIEGCKRCKNIDIFILHPHNRVSDVQRKQMTSVLEDNVHNLAIDGNFDDCQAMVKASFNDQSFMPEGRSLVAVNSINWARIMAQIVYYFYSALSVGGPHREVSFSVPTGNFGDIFAGYLASKMGLPVKQLIIATNKNDILHRCMSQNDHSRQELIPTFSPSMDIMASSNFERLLFDMYDRDGEAIAALMDDASQGSMTLDVSRLEKAKDLFSSDRVDDDMTCATIETVYEDCEYLLDPHSAVGVKAGRECRKDTETPLIVLSTAHPAKFPEAVMKAGQATEPTLPHHMADLFEREERMTVLPHEIAAVHQYINDSIDDGNAEK